MGLRAIAGATVTGFIMIYMFWFIIPALRTAYTNEITVINTNSTTMQTLLPITNSWFVLLVPLIAIAGLYTIYLYATRVESFDE